MPTRRQFVQFAATGALAVSAEAQSISRDRLLAIPPPGRVRVALDTDTAEIKSGTPVHLSLADSALHLFSLEDGRRISH